MEPAPASDRLPRRHGKLVMVAAVLSVVVSAAVLVLRQGLPDLGWLRTTPVSRGTLVLAPASEPGQAAETRLATEQQVLLSRPVLTRALERLGLDHDPRGEPALSTAVSVQPRPPALVLEVSVTHEDPKLAADLCNSVMEAYLETCMDKGQAERQWIVHSVGKNLDATQRQLAALDAVTEGGPEPAEQATQRAALTARLQALEAELVRAQLPRPNSARVLERCLVPRPD